MPPFNRQDLPYLFGSDVFKARTLRFAWHLMTVTWWGPAVLLLNVASASPAVGAASRSLPRLRQPLLAGRATTGGLILAFGGATATIERPTTTATGR